MDRNYNRLFDAELKVCATRVSHSKELVCSDTRLSHAQALVLPKIFPNQTQLSPFRMRPIGAIGIVFIRETFRKRSKTPALVHPACPFPIPVPSPTYRRSFPGPFPDRCR